MYALLNLCRIGGVLPKKCSQDPLLMRKIISKLGSTFTPGNHIKTNTWCFSSANDGSLAILSAEIISFGSKNISHHSLFGSVLYEKKKSNVNRARVSGLLMEELPSLYASCYVQRQLWKFLPSFLIGRG